MNVIFLMSSERSGSNLITKMFNSHPLVCGPSTSHIGDIFIPNLYAYNDEELSNDIVDVFNSKNSIWKSNLSKEEVLNFIKNNGVKAVFEYIYNKERIANNKEFIFVKENRIYEFSHFLQNNFPNANYLYMVRDPRAMAASWKDGFSMRGGVYRACDIWKRDQIGFLRHISWLEGKVPFIKFEDLISDPETTLRNVMNSLDIEYSEDMLSYYESEDAIQNSRNARDWKNVSKPLMSHKVDDFKKRLTDDEIKYIEYVCVREMNAFSYESVFPIVSEEEFMLIKTRVKALNLMNKPQFKSLPDSEKNRRSIQFQLSKSVFNKRFKVG